MDTPEARELPQDLAGLPQDLVFVDLETTGGNAAYHRITEIGIVRVENGAVVEEWSSLVNPECPIPSYIESFTGITNDMVASAPRFADVANLVLEKLCRPASMQPERPPPIFVAHNARFDYAFLRAEFRRAALHFSARVLCTVKLSRRLFPEHVRHNLDAVMERNGLVCSARHRALGDARVIGDFWLKLRRELPETRLSAAAQSLLGRKLPAHLPEGLAEEMPEGAGIYRFYGVDDVLLYVGRSNALRTTVLDYFGDDRPGGKARKVREEVRRIEWEETAGELGALLRELDCIKTGRPLHNRRVKPESESFTMSISETTGAVSIAAIAEVEPAALQDCFGVFLSFKDARKALCDIARARTLCPKVLGLEQSEGSCLGYQLGKCKGACNGKEPLLLHAMRVQMALSSLKFKAWPFPGRVALRERGPFESADWHVVDHWTYLGTARCEEELAELSIPETLPAFDAHVYRILARYFADHPKLDWHELQGSRRERVNENVLYWIATAPVGAASVLAEELAEYGAADIRERSHDVKFQGTLEVGYRACLWSRTATRVLLSLGSIDATSSKNIFEAVKRMDWRAHLAPGSTLACDCSGGNESIRHTIYGSQLLKDAVCDSLRESTGERPNIKPERPDVLLHLHVEGSTALVSVDFSGESLHRRGYRDEGGRAPLKENVAAAVLLRAGWREIETDGGVLIDPMCGSGTFLTEAALIASDAAPALDREYFGFSGWRGHDAQLWERLREEARVRRAARAPRRCILGSDIDADAVRMALANGEHAHVNEWLHVERRALDELVAPQGQKGLIVTNPPYGERIGAESGLPELYSALGRMLKAHFRGWQAAILTGNPPLARNLGIYAKRTHRVFNGNIECRLLRFDLNEASEQRAPEAVRADWSSRPGAQMFANRLRKNLKRLEPWAAQEHIDCFRAYDADMPEYAFAIDIYGREPRHVYLQEYAAPKSVDQEGARERRREALAALPDVLNVPLPQVHSRVRKPQKGAQQYEKRAVTAERRAVAEGGLKFWVNFRDYLDTGLFLDHRIIRQMLREWAHDADFLNLFCYTGSATVYAAAGGARTSVSVDLSNTYLDWAQENLKLNGFGGAAHELHRADCLEWLDREAAREPRFDLIFVDPPTFSNSKRMEGVLDVQRDHVGMIRRSLKLLRPGGRLVFSTNYTRFKLDAAALADVRAEDISAQTIPKDFERNPRIHRCFVIRQ